MSPTKDTIRFGFSGKLKPRYNHFDKIARVRDLIYELALPPSLDNVHNVFYISMLRKYIRDKSCIIPNYTELNIQPNVTYEEELVKILDKQNKVLRRKTIPLVKVLRKNWGHVEASWKRRT